MAYSDSDIEVEDDDSACYFDASPTSKPRRPAKRVQQQVRPGLGERSDSALELLMSEQPIQSPGRNGTRKSLGSLREGDGVAPDSPWDNLKKRMKSPSRLSSPTGALGVAAKKLVASSDHVVITRRRNTTAGTMSINMTGGARSRRSGAMSSTVHAGRRISRFDNPSPSESPRESAPRQRVRVRKKQEQTADSSADDDEGSVSSRKSLSKVIRRKKEQTADDDEGSVSSRKSLSKVIRRKKERTADDDEASVSSRKSISKSPGKRKKAKEMMEDDNVSVLSLKSRTGRRKSKKKELTSLTPNPKSKPLVEVEDPARFTDGGLQVGFKAGMKIKRRSTTDESGKISDGSPSLSSALSALPGALPFDDDDAGTVTSARTSASGKKSKKKGKRTSRASRLNVSTFENEIAALQEEVLRLKESKISGDSETSKHMQELRRKAFDARLELQKAQLENRQVRSELRDKTAALNEAEQDVESMEKKMKEKDAEIERLREQLKNAESDAPPPPPPPPSPLATPRSNGALIDRYETVIHRKDTKLANLERELRRLKKSGGAVDQTEQEDMKEEIAELQKALKENQSKTIAISKKYSEQRSELAQLEKEVEHWKSQAYGMEDDINETRSQLKYWMAKYEDVVGASDTAKAQLPVNGQLQLSTSSSFISLNELSTLDMGMESDGGKPEEDKLEEDKPEERGGLWSRLTSPRVEKPKLSADNMPM